MKPETRISNLPTSKLILLLAMLIALATNATAQVAAIDSDRPRVEDEQEQIQKYTCLMHPEVITDYPGNCPKCGMELVPLKKKKRRTPNVQRSTSNIEHRTSHNAQLETQKSHMSHLSDATHQGEMEMSMHSTIDLTDPMSREGSGTSWIPDSSPMYGRMFMFGEDMLMLPGAATIGSMRRTGSWRCFHIHSATQLSSVLA
jgi:hypothetical protein